MRKKGHAVCPFFTFTDLIQVIIPDFIISVSVFIPNRKRRGTKHFERKHYDTPAIRAPSSVIME